MMDNALEALLPRLDSYTTLDQIYIFDPSILHVTQIY